MKLRWLILGLLGSLALAQGFGGKAGVGGKAGIGGGVPSGGAVAFDAVGPTSGTTTSQGLGVGRPLRLPGLMSSHPAAAWLRAAYSLLITRTSLLRWRQPITARA